MRTYNSTSLSVSSGFGPPWVNQCSFLSLLRSSVAFNWFRVGFFFFFIISTLPAESSAPLATGVPVLEPAGLWRRERTGVLAPLPFGDFASKASSITATLPWCVILPASTFHISGPMRRSIGVSYTHQDIDPQSAETNSLLWDMITFKSPVNKLE